MARSPVCSVARPAASAPRSTVPCSGCAVCSALSNRRRRRMVDHDEMAQRLNRFWNAEVRRAPSNPDALDPTLAETVRRLRTCDDAPAPDPAFVARLGAALILPTPRSRSTGEGGGVVAPPSPVERERGAGGVTAERAREARGV